MLGVEYPANGLTYAGIISFIKTSETKEYFYQQITTPLISGKSYYVSFFVSLADRVPYAIKNIGAYFSVSQPSASVSNTFIAANPQIINNNGFLTDTVGWTKIEGYFTALGGEKYISIGNFNSNANTDTLFVNSYNPHPGALDYSYYYIDSVSLYDSLDYALITNIKKMEDNFKVNLYPNPNNGNMTLEYDLGSALNGKMLIFDITGKLISSYNLTQTIGKLDINNEPLINGVYYYSIFVNEKIYSTNKIVIIK